MRRAADPALLEATGAVLLDDRSRDAPRGLSYLFVDPVDTITAQEPHEVPAALAAIDRHTSAGRCVAGYLAYEAGIGLDKPIVPRGASGIPLIWLGVYERWTTFTAEAFDDAPGDPPECIRGIELNVPVQEYLDRVGRIKQYILEGDVYQVNYTCKLLFRNSGTAAGLFWRLRRAHPVGHSAFVNLGATRIASLSPELFLRRQGALLLTRPMKGTSRRGRWCDEDETVQRLFAVDEKCRAENLMIVDLMRNDIGRIAIAGGVDVPRLFSVERYPSLFQMTSDVTGRLPASVTTEQVLRATFPAGSVTGAPKIRAMEIIREAEREDRGVYCGCIGAFWPNGDLLLNVAIRTIVQNGERCEMGIGGAIVADSRPEEELEEARIKGGFLYATPATFDLLETLAFHAGAGYRYLEEHLTRMERSAAYFGRRFDRAEAQAALSAAAAGGSAGDRLRVRLLLGPDGSFRTEVSPLDAPPAEPVDVLLAQRRLDPAEVHLYHKTSNRAEFDRDLRMARQCGCYEALYLNNHGEITQGSYTNLVVEIDGRTLTPPVSCGLLPGIWRAALLADRRAAEQELTPADLSHATRMWIGNSVRGAIEVRRILAVAPAHGPEDVVWHRP